ncbi:hypothetical protein BGZ65_002662 [Modicella reniformis]|uniref:Uncharacterized protein n=1 Tax=Modicella reniformis TaxID=1440133 RepID=A0A9P6M9L1_9FUNG|nr:hypothetical protein BGZ65_002662 [Modicella reniformis]
MLTNSKPTDMSTSSTDNNIHHEHHLLSAFRTFESTSSRPRFWASLKEHYLAATQVMPWGSTSNNNTSSNIHSTANQRDFAPPIALLVSNSSPTVTLDATPWITCSSSSVDDTLLSLPHIDSLPEFTSVVISNYKTEVPTTRPYQVSVAAMDKFKVMRDVIPLKTFTYCETIIKDLKRPAAHRSLVKRSSSSSRSGSSSPAAPAPSPSPVAPEKERRKELPPLPRHLAIRDTRSNPDYLRMMACELTMVRSLKLIAPLKPRGYLPRRKELFCYVKSPLSVAVELPCDDDRLLVGSWTSVSSTESFFSTTSSDYITTDEGYE